MTDLSQKWFTCDGNGDGDTSARQPALPSSRRMFVRGAVGAALAAWLGKTALQDAAFAADGDDAGRDVLVVLFLRGGADGLGIVAPFGDPDLYRHRPTLAISPKDVLKLDDFFGFNPALSGLLPLYKDGQLAVIHAVGSGDNSRSHFEAMATMERGVADQKISAGSGWVARHLQAAPPVHPSPLRAVALENLLPDMLRGAIDVSVFQSLTEFRLHTPEGEHGKSLVEKLSALYHPGDDPVSRAGRETLAALEAVKRLDITNAKPQNGADYPKSELGDGLRQVAQLIRANVGLEVATLSRGGWDTHVAQGGTVGWLALQLKDVGDSLAAFAKDLGSDGMKRVSVVIHTEFGRRVYENDGLGTDHGRASVMFVLGGGINGGKVHGIWPGLAKDKLEEPGDLRVTTDYRRVLAEIVARRLGGREFYSQVFPGIAETDFLGVAQTA